MDRDMTRTHARFGRSSGGSGAYTCGECGKRTRDTGHGEAPLMLCKRCYVLASVYNVHDDNAHAGPFESCPECRANVASYGLTL